MTDGTSKVPIGFAPALNVSQTGRLFRQEGDKPHARQHRIESPLHAPVAKTWLDNLTDLIQDHRLAAHPCGRTCPRPKISYKGQWWRFTSETMAAATGLISKVTFGFGIGICYN